MDQLATNAQVEAGLDHPIEELERVHAVDELVLLRPWPEFQQGFPQVLQERIW